ncbi:hypothetical protein [Ruegeria sp. MALMAid1280]|uniref:hypothetical protein n=1 Tax=Ruegeria sp. MALMAid1280 TaxID=3411634 RepID=UPI003BA353C8
MARVYILISDHDAQFGDDLQTVLSEHNHRVQSSIYKETGTNNFHEDIYQSISQVDVLVIVAPKDFSDLRATENEFKRVKDYFSQLGLLEIVEIRLIENGDIEIVSSFERRRCEGHDLDEVGTVIGNALRYRTDRQRQKSELRQAVEASAAEFIEKSQKNLKERETRNRNYAHTWYVFACVVLLVGVALSLWRLGEVNKAQSNVYSLLEVGLLGLISMGLIIAIAKFSFTLGKSYMVESLRNADRSHAISFGEFYLKSFGANSDWSELKEAFQHWNIDSGSVFSEQQSADFDPKLIETASALAKVMVDSSKKVK